MPSLGLMYCPDWNSLDMKGKGACAGAQALTPIPQHIAHSPVKVRRVPALLPREPFPRAQAGTEHSTGIAIILSHL